MGRPFRAPRLSVDKPGVELSRQMRDDLILHVEEIGERLVEALGPKVRARLGFNELHIDAHSIPGALQAAVEHVAYIELPSDLLGVGGICLCR